MSCDMKAVYSCSAQQHNEYYCMRSSSSSLTKTSTSILLPVLGLLPVVRLAQ